LSLAINHDGAAATLARRGAAVLWRCDVQLLTKSGEEMGVVHGDGDVSTIDLE